MAWEMFFSLQLQFAMVLRFLTFWSLTLAGKFRSKAPAPMMTTYGAMFVTVRPSEKIFVWWVYIGKSREIWRGKYDWAVSSVAEGKGREVGCCTWQGSNQGQFGHFNILLSIFLAF